MEAGEFQAFMNGHMAVKLPKRYQDRFLGKVFVEPTALLLNVGKFGPELQISQHGFEFAVAAVAGEVTAATAYAVRIKDRPERQSLIFEVMMPVNEIEIGLL